MTGGSDEMEEFSERTVRQKNRQKKEKTSENAEPTLSVGSEFVCRDTNKRDRSLDRTWTESQRETEGHVRQKMLREDGDDATRRKRRKRKRLTPNY